MCVVPTRYALRIGGGTLAATLIACGVGTVLTTVASEDLDEVSSRFTDAKTLGPTQTRLSFDEFLVALLPRYLSNEAKERFANKPVSSFASPLRELAAKDGTLDLAQFVFVSTLLHSQDVEMVARLFGEYFYVIVFIVL
jgi:hypothetical protein